ncbi:BlaI/MecI/CopY family transcriptional regulator [Sphingomonas hankyongi]|uniref:BlaI/MecI/CopY family transcriptional regulator n=1 Tax=Sphingomonas hankyongi TaxID=2908209 RepID=A0ABT0RZP9_9SPHN|nr:BlaI/MecI/CopY family transcriptional regulator [Sphingomonas hankyongi]MCL6729075.1 BlaI/MecI/CopY family transcriptional regulator [Sphingomonas hankyongi]
MARRTPRITEAEMQLLQLLWQDSPLGASDVFERLPQSLQWSLTTVKTLLSRLVTKGAVTAEQQGRRNLYSPAVAQNEVAARQAGGLVDRLFGGKVSPLVAQLAEQRELDPKDLEELEALVRRLRK